MGRLPKPDFIPAEPYTSEDMRKPGFDPVAAYHDWLERRWLETKEQQEAQRAWIIEQVRLEVAEFQRNRHKPKPKPKPPPQMIDKWKAALREVRKQKRG